MIRRPPRSTLFPTRRSSDLFRPVRESAVAVVDEEVIGPKIAGYVQIVPPVVVGIGVAQVDADRKSTRLNSSHGYISYAVVCLEKKTGTQTVHALSGTQCT